MSRAAFIADTAAVLVCLLLLLALLTACGGGDPEPDKRAEPPKCGAPGVCV